MLRTQVSPYVLIGHLADLPNPASVAQGMLYHSDDTGDCFVLQIEPDTGVRHWVEFCGATGITGIEGPALLKWSGSGDVSAMPFVIADAISTSVSAAGVVPAYPLFRARTALNFSINIRQNQPNSIVTVTLLINGVASAMTHTFASGATGVFNVPGPVAIPAGALIDVRVSQSGIATSGTVAVSATLELF